MTLTSDHVKNTCKIGQGELTCGYLTIGANGCQCCKGTELEIVIQQRMAKNSMKSKGDNCEGTTGTIRLEEL